MKASLEADVRQLGCRYLQADGKVTLGCTEGLNDFIVDATTTQQHSAMQP